MVIRRNCLVHWAGTAATEFITIDMLLANLKITAKSTSGCDALEGAGKRLRETQARQERLVRASAWRPKPAPGPHVFSSPSSSSRTALLGTLLVLHPFDALH